MNYRPEGSLIKTEENLHYISSAQGLTEAMEKNIILEARAVLCNSLHDLIVEFPCGKGIIKREDGALGIKDGTVRDIAIISRVNKSVCFKVINVSEENGTVIAELSRCAAQTECSENYIQKLTPGDIIDARVTHIEQFGAFVDIGCGISSLIPIDVISVSRISHPSDRFVIGQNIKAIVKASDKGRIYLSHKELLGTWKENAENFNIGETVTGIVRSVESYGIFVELAPNLAGLAEPKENISVGQSVSVFIKAIISDKMKVKLVIVDVGDYEGDTMPMKYYLNGDHVRYWEYAPEMSKKKMTSYFE